MSCEPPKLPLKIRDKNESLKQYHRFDVVAQHFSISVTTFYVLIDEKGLGGLSF